MKIIEKNKAVCSLILPEKPTKREVFAAEELISYIEKISGAHLIIGDGYENKIVIGSPGRNPFAREIISQNEFRKEVSGTEGFMIYAKGNMLLLAGNDDEKAAFERGTIYSIYEFLERYLGCSLSAYGKRDSNVGEYIPVRESIEIFDTKYVKSDADIPYRTAIVQYSDWLGNPDHLLNEQFISFLSKNRYNRILTWAGIYERFKENGMLKEAEKRGIVFSVGHHESIRLFLPPEGNEYFSEKYYETHPEFYKLLEDGTRYFMKERNFGGQFILCARNREGIEIFSKNIITWLDRNPQVDTICLWPNDGISDGCLCPECKKYSKTVNYTYFVDEVSKIVCAQKPYVKIDQIAYVDMFDCESDKISSNVIIDESTWHSSGLRTVGKPDGSCLSDTLYENALLKWKEAGAQVVYYDYFMGDYSALQKWMPMADEIQAMVKRFMQKGIMGLGTQIEPFNVWNNVFNFYCYGRTAYDSSLSIKDNLDSFCMIFGKAAPIMKEIILLGENEIDGQTSLTLAGQYLIENIDKKHIYEMYDMALAAAETKKERNNVRLMRMVFRYSDLLVNNPLLEVEGRPIISKNADDTGELWYMREHFDSFLSGNEGYGVAFAVEKRSDAIFVPDHWYIFE